MTEHVIGPDSAPESLSERASRRLRGALAENRIPQVALARALHLPQQTLSRKVNGTTAFSLDEIELVAHVLNVSVDAILGTGEYAERPLGALRLVDPGTTTPGGGTLFLPPGEVSGAPSGTRTPNPLIQSLFTGFLSSVEVDDEVASNVLPFRPARPGKAAGWVEGPVSGASA